MQKHYVCLGGCGAISDKPGICHDENCPNKGLPLVDCACYNGEHGGVAQACENCGKLCKLDEGTCEMEPFKEEISA